MSSSGPLIAPPKPKNARSKRAAMAREPVAVEKGAKTAVFVRGAGISEKVKVALSELNQLKKPHAISFSKSNAIRPFEDASSLEFWSTKNDASLFLVGTHTKKRPHGLVWVRCFGGEVMEMLEVGIEEIMGMSSFKGIKSTPGSTPLFHFASTSPHQNLWDSHPTYTQFKSILLDFFRGVEMDAVSLKGLERVVSVTIGGDAHVESEAAQADVEHAVGGKGKAVESLIGAAVPRGGGGDYDEDKTLPVVHFRTYTVSFMRSGVPTPLVALSPHGPHITFSLRRSQLPSTEMWKAALKKTVKKVSTGKKVNKNIDIDEMGDKVGRVYVDQQDLSKLQARKFKGLKTKRGADESADVGTDAQRMKKAQLANTAIHREALEAAGQKLNATGPSGGVVKDKNGRDRSKDIGRVRNKKRPAEDFVFMEGTRKSSRQSGVLQDPVLIEERRKAEDEFFAAQQEELNKAKHAPRDLVALHGVVGSGTTEELIVRLERLAMEPVPPPVERSTGEPTEDATEAEVEALQEQLNTIVFRGIAKVVPERIYSIAVHPSTTKDIVFAGDKQGAVAYWDATAAAEGDLESSPHYYWKAHQHTVADLKFAPNDPTRLYSASYDATIRRTDLNTGRSEEVIDVDRFAYDGLVHSIDFSPDGNEIWAVDNHGGLLHRDIREPMETTRRWGIDRAKIGCFSLNAANPYLAATGHLKRITKLWDLRKLTGMPQEATEEELNSCVIKTFDYAKACSSAFFDHSGTRLLSTSYDDFIRVWNINPHDLESIRESEFVPKFEEPHNNQSGRYVSVLKARWANHGASHFSIGGMSQGLEVFNGATGQMMASLNDQLVTAVPAVTATHPTRPMRFYGGTGSGKLHFFAPPEPESE